MRNSDLVAGELKKAAGHGTKPNLREFGCAGFKYAGLYMAEDQIVNTDDIRPIEIEHRCDEIFEGAELLQRYNYIVYHFDCDGSYFWARAYTDDIATVSVCGPFESRDKRNLTSGPLDEAMLSYLKRRFRKIQKLGKEGYTIVWPRQRQGE